jgi:hypothetical protein
MTSFLGLIIELTVVILLALTVTYCIILDRRLQRMRADETSMRQTVVDLGMATERAERAIDGMRNALADADKTLGERLKAAEATSLELVDSIRSGDEVLDRIGRIVVSARKVVDEMHLREPTRPAPAPAPAPAPPPVPRVSDTLAAAEAFAERTRRRVLDNAA